MTTPPTPTKGCTNTVDPKLLHLVKKMVTLSDVSTHNVDYIVTILRTQHREYLRKDLDKLKIQVEASIQKVLGPSLSLSSRKRKADEEEYDKLASKEDREREQLGVGGGLNASLRDRYRQVQQVRDTNPPSESEETHKRDDSGRAEKNTERKDSSESKNAKRKKLKNRKLAGSSSGISGDNPDAAFLTPVSRPTERYLDLGGMDEVVKNIRQLVEYPLIRPELYSHLGVDPPRGVLLRGPPGTGKTHLANAGTVTILYLVAFDTIFLTSSTGNFLLVAGQLGVPFFRVSAPELVSGMSGESEGRIRDLFRTASSMAPAIIFLDELDAIVPKRSEAGSSRGMEKRMVAQLLTSMDMLAPVNNNKNSTVIVLAATNRADAMDPALRRAGRFDKEISLGVPDEQGRERILRAMTKGMRLSGDFDFKVLARKTPGFVGADVRSLAKEAAVLAINRIFKDVLKDQDSVSDELVTADGEVDNSDTKDQAIVSPMTAEQMEPLFVTMDDFLCAIPMVQPSSKREGFATVPDVTWDDIGALHCIREELTMSVLEPIRNPEKFQALGLPLPAGVMLYGPPGCGKTLLAKAIAHESGANFISVKGPELLDKYVGESEKAVRLVFERARSSSPCIVFFDELDSLVPRRGSDAGGGGVTERVVNQLLTEMDGLESRRSVFVIAATNRPELIDPAMMRPGRLDKLLFVPLPGPEDRVLILKALCTGINLAADVDMDHIGRSPRTDGYSGADCAALLREAGLAVLKEDATAFAAGKPDSVELKITSKHFDAAFHSVMPSVSKNDQARYERIRDRMARARSRATVVDAKAPDVVDALAAEAAVALDLDAITVPSALNGKARDGPCKTEAES
jgi:ribosome biogenesis ATPase